MARSSSSRGRSVHFLALRRRLDLLGYSDFPLGLDSAPLVGQMMEDLVSGTETLQQSETQIATTRHKIEELEARLEPLQSENIRLTRENVQLHQQLITGTEEAVRQGNEQSASSTDLEAKNRRLRLLNEKATSHVKSLQKLIEQLREELRQAQAAPAMLKIPEVIESDPRKIRKGSRTPTSSRATSVISSIASTFSAPSITFDPSLFTIELENLKKSLSAAREKAESAISEKTELEAIVKIRDEEIAKLGEKLQLETGKDGLLVLRHQIETQSEEIEKLRVQVKVVNPATSPTRRKRFLLVPPHVTVSILGDNSSVASGAQLEGKEAFTYQAIGPMGDSRGATDSQSSAVPESVDEAELPKVREALVPEPQEEKITLTKRQLEERKKLEMQLKTQQKQGKAKDREITELSTHVQVLTKTLEEKEKAIADLTVDFAFVSDGLEIAIHEKEAMIAQLKAHCEEPDEVIVDTEELDKLRVELENARERCGLELHTKRIQVERLQSELQPKPCHECEILRKQFDEARAKIRAGRRNAKQKGKIQERNQQLELLLQTSEDQRVDGTELDQQLRVARNELTIKDGELEDMRVTTNTRQLELEEIRRKVEETGQKLQQVPNAEEKYTSVIDQLKLEHTQLVFEMKQKGTILKGLNERMADAQRTIRDLQSQLQRARDEASSYKEDAIYHRTKGEEIQRKTTDQTRAYVREANANVQNLQQQLDEKTKQSAVYQRLLADARRQLAPLTETTLPGLRGQLAKMATERAELIRHVKRVVQFSGYVDQLVSVYPQSPDAGAFCAAFRHVQEELKLFDK